jgi:CRP-like cAMP-binding protein
VEESRLLHLRGAAVRALMERIPRVAIGLVEGLVAKGTCYSKLLQMLGTRSVIERLAQLLLVLADLHGRREGDTGDAVAIERPITHEFLANMVGSTRQWVTSTLERFRKQGIVALDGRRLVILDPAALRELTG